MMKLSIITITYNCQNTVARCLDSMAKQTYDNIEYIIVDGGSTDGTLKVIESYSKIIDQFISEPDEGIYDALNKGLRIATGEVIGFLHADDVFASNMTLHNIMHVFMSSNSDVVYGDIEILKNIDDVKPKRKWISRKFHPSLLGLGWMPAHTSLFVKSSLYSEFGDFDTSFSISGDYEFYLRNKDKIVPAFFDDVNFYSGIGVSSSVLSFIENYKVWKSLGIHNFIFRKILLFLQVSNYYYNLFLKALKVK